VAVDDHLEAMGGHVVVDGGAGVVGHQADPVASMACHSARSRRSHPGQGTARVRAEPATSRRMTNGTAGSLCKRSRQSQFASDVPSVHL
jgi:hypothetical protein